MHSLWKWGGENTAYEKIVFFLGGGASSLLFVQHLFLSKSYLFVCEVSNIYTWPRSLSWLLLISIPNCAKHPRLHTWRQVLHHLTTSPPPLRSSYFSHQSPRRTIDLLWQGMIGPLLRLGPWLGLNKHPKGLLPGYGAWVPPKGLSHSESLGFFDPSALPGESFRLGSHLWPNNE